MHLLATQPRSIFLGQGIAYDGVATFRDLDGIPMSQRLELPVAEELQTGIAIGLAIQGFLPISVHPRMDFLLRAADQLVNHLDKMAMMSNGQFSPKIIIRTKVGTKTPLDAGPQHTQNHSSAFRLMFTNVVVETIDTIDQIMPAYEAALNRQQSTLIVEMI